MRNLSYVLASTDFGPMIINRMDWATAGKNPQGEEMIYGVGAQLLNTGTFDAQEIDLYRQLLHLRHECFGDGVHVLDCGANIGTITVALAAFLHGRGTVTGIEVQERLFYCLAGNVVLGNHHNARVLWGAVGARNGTMQIPVPDYGENSSFGSLEMVKSANTEFIGQTISYDPASMATVPAFTVDSLNLQRLDLLKIDVENMELDVLEGARETIARCKPIIAIEFLKTGADAIAAWLFSAGYERQIVTGIMVFAIHPGDPVGRHISFNEVSE